MRAGQGFRSGAGVTATTLVGALFFFGIIGVFGLPFAIAGLALFACGAIVIDLLFPAGDGS